MREAGNAGGLILALFAALGTAACGAAGKSTDLDAAADAGGGADSGGLSDADADLAGEAGGGDGANDSGDAVPDGGATPPDTGVDADAAAADLEPGSDLRADAPASEAAVPDGGGDGMGDRDATADVAVPDGGGDGNRDAGASDATGACTVCAAYGTPTLAGRVSAAALANVSGMAASQRNPGVVFVHNDMARAEFFALSETAALLGTFTFTGTPVVDMEDMAVGHCPGGTCVYLADIGGNISSRTSFAIVRLPEPMVSPGQVAATIALTAEKLTFSYSDGAVHNAESLVVDPTSDKLYVITKEATGPSTVYRLSGTFGGPAVVAEKVVTLTVPKTADGPATGASAHPCGAGFLLRTNTVVYEFRIAVGASFESAFTATPARVPLLVETQGEAVSYRPDGRGYLTTGEGAMEPINQVGCM